MFSPLCQDFGGRGLWRKFVRGKCWAFTFSARSSRRSLGWIGPYIGSNRISRRGSKIQSKKTHQHHHHEKKMEDGSGNTQRKPVMVDPRNIPYIWFECPGIFTENRDFIYFLSFFLCFIAWMFYFKFGELSCYVWTFMPECIKFMIMNLYRWKIWEPVIMEAGISQLSFLKLFVFCWNSISPDFIWARGQVVSCFSISIKIKAIEAL